MVASLLCSLLFAFSAVCGNRSTRILGGVQANFWRILLATFFLGLYAHSLGSGFSGAGLPIFLLSGLIGFGVGDLALYQALPRLGSRLSIMIVHCLAAPFAALLEWIWLGTTLTTAEICASLIILIGVAVALSPSEHIDTHRTAFKLGIFYATLAALGQGGGAVLSRKAYEVLTAAAQNIDGITAAYQRIWGGVGIALLSMLLLFFRTPSNFSTAPIKKASGWVFLNALAGPALGVSVFQWALATTPTGIVLPIVALTPLLIIPFAKFIEGEHASLRSIMGGAVAVLGVILLGMVA